LRLKDKIGLGEVELAEISLLLDLCAQDEEGGVIQVVTGTPVNGYVAEDGVTFYVAEDGSTFYVQEF
jgi:hypothetical protein